MENNSRIFLNITSAALLALTIGCSSPEKVNPTNHPHQPTALEGATPSENGHSGDPLEKPAGSDFTPAYRQQVEQAEADADKKKQKTKKRDKRVDDLINRDDRRERK